MFDISARLRVFQGGTPVGTLGERSKEKVAKLRELAVGRQSALVLMQDNPDPDALASAAGLREILHALCECRCTIAYGGIIGRAENKAMAEYLALNMQEVSRIDFSKYDLLALVDTQPGQGNNSLPPETKPDIVIDHHPFRREGGLAPHSDIRSNYGATATIIVEYLDALELAIEPKLATALFYGIMTDTQDLGREGIGQDINAALLMFPMANKRLLARIEYGRLPREYYRVLEIALKEAVSYGPLVASCLWYIDVPDSVAEVADLLSRLEGAEWTFCSGFSDGNFHFSLRTSSLEANAGEVAKALVRREGSGGGHGSTAAGRVPIPKSAKFSAKRFYHKFVRRLRKLLEIKESEEKLLPRSRRRKVAA